MQERPTTLRLQIEIGLLIAVLLGYLFLVFFFAHYECFEPQPKVFHRVCNVDFWTEKITGLFTLKSP